VLFIDEAYQSAERERGGFGQEAIGTLRTRMENHRDRLVVIVAGSYEKMKEFRKTNPGLPRRFPEENVLAFPDYQPNELLDILYRMLQERNPHGFGNGRAVRNLFEEMKERLAERIATSEEENGEFTFTEGDVPPLIDGRPQHVARSGRPSISLRSCHRHQ